MAGMVADMLGVVADMSASLSVSVHDLYVSCYWCQPFKSSPLSLNSHSEQCQPPMVSLVSLASWLTWCAFFLRGNKKKSIIFISSLSTHILIQYTYGPTQCFDQLLTY